MGRDLPRRKWHFLKPNILDTINKFVLSKHKAILSCKKTQGHHPQHLELNESLREHKANHYFMLKIADNHRACKTWMLAGKFEMQSN